jgi:hypothetical protein
MDKRLSSLIVTIGLFLSSLTFSPAAHADAGREFLLSCTYGILAGALVGAASLAVEDDPSSKVHRVARGASLGLYSGIMLGLYVVYVVPAQLESQDADDLQRFEERVLPGDYGLRKVIKKYEPPRVALMPVIENYRVTGAALTYNIANF